MSYAPGHAARKFSVQPYQHCSSILCSEWYWTSVRMHFNLKRTSFSLMKFSLIKQLWWFNLSALSSCLQLISLFPSPSTETRLRLVRRDKYPFTSLALPSLPLLPQSFFFPHSPLSASVILLLNPPNKMARLHPQLLLQETYCPRPYRCAKINTCTN